MKKECARTESPRTGRFAHRLLVAAAAMIALAAASPWVLWVLPHAPVICPFQILFGVPCPGCGATRSFFALGSGHIVTSVRLNPLGVVLWLFLAAVVAFQVGLLPRRLFEKAKQKLTIVGISAAFVAWFVMLTQRLLN